MVGATLIGHRPRVCEYRTGVELRYASVSLSLDSLLYDLHLVSFDYLQRRPRFIYQCSRLMANTLHLVLTGEPLGSKST